MKNLLIMLAVTMIPAAAGCNCCGLGSGLGTCPCNPCNWFNRGAYCGPATYAAPIAAPVAAPVCPPAMTPAIAPQVVPQQYVMPTQAPVMPYAAPMMAAPSQAAPYAYMEPGCAYVEPGCGYMGNVGYGGYGPVMPMEMSGTSSDCCDTGSYDPGAMMTPVTPMEQVIDPQPAE
jgi:hypothetical protein